jgi:Uma2 family endonuclease
MFAPIVLTPTNSEISLRFMLIAAENLVTIDDFRKLPQGPPYYQLIQGRLLVSPSPNRYHQVLCQNLFFILRKFLEVKPVGDVFLSPSDVYLTGYDAYQPDLYFVSNANAAILTPQGAAGAPDLVIEILSPGTAHYDRDLKRKVYAQTGVKELWLIDPDAKEIQVLHLSQAGKKPSVVRGADSKFSSALLPGLVISTSEVFKPSRLG